ncbi:PREDICTED: uncharacterized protein LOC106107877 isoform X1 [Papilio polytes]|uniref:uncharacterized protein LOC106107877 isoform X1 n=1 Tax=Papilio polytes TaxID=76194 RepID=UPI000676053B|nr:PREDICTED: uncharacterized protein LOC106107877 isoform X1 [Papilio polytes]
MESLVLQGNNLGEKHKHYNELLKTAIKDYPLDLSPIDYHDSDVNNMLKIDVACSRKDVNYIINVLKCTDMFYVTKVIKKINWLLTNEEYVNVINPQYLHTTIFPELTVKAKIMLLLHIRLSLKKETRVEEFFDFFKDTNLIEALKWLPNCSHSFIENAIKTYNAAINVHILKRLFKKSIKFLTTYLNSIICKHKSNQQVMEVTTFLMKNHLKEYLNILESLKESDYPTFGPKHTKILMKKAPQIVLNNFVKYGKIINLQTFAKFVQPEPFLVDILLSDHDKNIEVPWFDENALDILFTAMPKEKIPEFVEENVLQNTNKLKYFMFLAIPHKSIRWYKYICFETACLHITESIRAESLPKKRMMMMEILLLSAENNMENVEETLEYFRSYHINESLVYKKDFILKVFKQVDAFRLSNKGWEDLNVIYLSIEDLKSEKKKDQRYIKAAIIRKIINNDGVSEILEKNFNFESMKLYRKKLNEKECEMIFNYLYSYSMKQVNLQDISNEMELKNMVTWLRKVLILLSDWEKDLANFPEVVKVITELIDLKTNKFKDVNLSSLYNVNKSWRKELFTISLNLSLSQNVCINVLKHDSKLLLESKHFMGLLACRDFTNLQKLLSKIRIYWPASANEAISFCLDSLNNRGDKALIKHLMYLLPVSPLKEIVFKYIPSQESIYWIEDNKLLLSKTKNIAKYMHIARPQLPIKLALSYAGRDYLQFTISSLNSMLYNMSEVNTRTCIKELLDSRVSLRKHVIRVAIDKLKYKEIIKLFRNAWIIIENKSIRVTLFKATFKLLCKEKEISAITSIWKLLLFYLPFLTETENVEIYETLTKTEQVPPIIQAGFWSTSVIFFKCKDTICDQKYYIQKVLYSARCCLDTVNTKTLAEILLKNIQHDILSMELDTEFIASCILYTKTIERNIHRYHAIMTPIMEICVTYWDVKKDNKYIYRVAFESLLASLCKVFTFVVLPRHMIIPDDSFSNILKFMERKIPNEENYILLMTWRLSCKLIHVIKMNSFQKGCCDRETEYCNFILSKAAPQLGEEIQKCLREDIKNYYPSIYICISNAVHSMFCYFNFSNSVVLLILKSILCVDLKESYLLVLELIPRIEIVDGEATSEILDIIKLHPSKEVKLHYHNRRNENFYRFHNDLIKLTKGDIEMKTQVCGGVGCDANLEIKKAYVTHGF